MPADIVHLGYSQFMVYMYMYTNIHSGRHADKQINRQTCKGFSHKTYGASQQSDISV